MIGCSWCASVVGCVFGWWVCLFVGFLVCRPLRPRLPAASLAVLSLASPWSPISSWVSLSSLHCLASFTYPVLPRPPVHVLFLPRDSSPWFVCIFGVPVLSLSPPASGLVQPGAPPPVICVIMLSPGLSSPCVVALEENPSTLVGICTRV